jgi:ADP-heptose:LPS heptosyltransferase
MTATRRLLAIHPGALGDVLQAVPALRALRGDAGDRHLSLAAQPRLARLLAGAGVVDEALSFEALGLAALFADDPVPPALAARLGAFDSIVSWFGARAPSYAARLTTLAPRVILAAPVPAEDEPTALPVWRHLLATVAPLGPSASPVAADAGPLRAPLAIPDEWRARGRAALAAAGLADERPLLVVHAGAGGPWKRWPAERFAETIARAADGCAVLLHEGPADREAVGALERRLDALGAAAGRTRLVAPELEALAAVLADARAYLGGDSGVSQLAAAAGAAAVVLYPEATLARWTPWGPRVRALPASDDGADVEHAADTLAGLLRARTS